MIKRCNFQIIMFFRNNQVDKETYLWYYYKQMCFSCRDGGEMYV